MSSAAAWIRPVIALVSMGLVGGLAGTLHGQPLLGGPGELSDAVPMIPRSALIQPPQRQSVQISPDGQRLAFVVATADGPEMQITRVDDASAARALALPEETDYANYRWCFTNQHLVLSAGVQQRYLYSYAVADGTVKPLTPQNGGTPHLVALSERSPAEAVVLTVTSAEARLSRVNIVTGQRQPIHVSARFDGFLVDDSYRLRLAYQRTPDGGRVFALPGDADDAEWPLILRIEPADHPRTRPIAFDADGTRVFLIDSRNTIHAELRTLDLNTSAEETLASSPHGNVLGVLFHPSERTVQAVRYDAESQEWDFRDQRIAADMKYLATVTEGKPQIISRSLNDERWVIGFDRDAAPRDYFLFDRIARRATYLFSADEALLSHPLVPMHTAMITMVGNGFLSLPTPAVSKGRADRPQEPLPTVIIVHDPATPQRWGLNAWHQLLANRGYAVLSVNPLGVDWDLNQEPAVQVAQWAVSEGIAAPDRIALLGRGSGATVALEAMVVQPELFACGVLQEGKLTSPARRYAELDQPLLLMQGARHQQPFEQLAKSLTQRQVAVTFVSFADEPDSMRESVDHQAASAILEAFLAERLGGRTEPLDQALRTASLQVPIGPQHVPGLNQALRR